MVPHLTVTLTVAYLLAPSKMRNIVYLLALLWILLRMKTHLYTVLVFVFSSFAIIPFFRSLGVADTGKE